jgi:DNA-binding transcriptional MerR regulator
VVDRVFQIGELSRRSGLSVDVIRAWERRYGLLRPRRTGGNFRQYGSDDVSRLLLMRHYLRQGLPTSRAAALVIEAQAAPMSSNPGVPTREATRAVDALRRSLEAFEDAPAERVLQRLLALFARAVVLRDVVLPYLRDLGERWACGEATVAAEHFASSFIERWMAVLSTGWRRPARRRAVLACVPGERHTLGLMAFGIVLRDLGWSVVYMGSDTPMEALASAVREVSADAVVLSAVMPETFRGSRDRVAELAARAPVAVGGPGVDAASSGGALLLPRDLLAAGEVLSQPARPVL